MSFKNWMPVLAIISVVGVGCSSSSTSSSTSDIDTVSANSGAIIAAVFSTSPDGNVSSLVKQIQEVIKNQGAPTTCESLDGGEASVAVEASGESGTYGTASDAATVDADTDFCEDSEGNANDSDGVLYASFTVTSGVVTCDDDSTATLSGTGIFRQDGDFCPEIFGNFTMTAGGETSEANCTIRLSCETDGEVLEATCDDGEGNTLTLSSDVSCSIDA